MSMMDIDDYSNRNTIILEESRPKKKSRGNRIMHRYRRKLRNQGMKPDTIVKSITEWVNMAPSTAEKITELNTETTKTSANDTIVCSLVPIQHKEKMLRKKKIIKRRKLVKKKKTASSRYLSTRKVKASANTKDSVDYNTIPDEIFLQMLSTDTNGTQKLDCYLNGDEQMKFIRQYTSLIDRICYLELQKFQWKYYHHIGMSQNIWTGRIAKHVAEKFSIVHTYGRSKGIIEQRLNQIETSLQQAQDAIQQFEEDTIQKCTANGGFPKTMKELSSIVHRFVQEQQKPLQHEFYYKREILTLDATDHQLFRIFFDAQPNKTHIILAKIIWQATKKQMMIEEEIAMLRNRLTSTHPISSSNLLDRMIDDIDTIIKNLGEPVENSTTSTSSSDTTARMQLLKSDIINQAIETSYRSVRDEEQVRNQEKQKFSLRNRFMKSTQEWQQVVYDAIQSRELHMINRAHFIMNHKLNTKMAK